VFFTTPSLVVISAINLHEVVWRLSIAKSFTTECAGILHFRRVHWALLPVSVCTKMRRLPTCRLQTLGNPPWDRPLLLTPSGTATAFWTCTGLCILGGMPGGWHPPTPTKFDDSFLQLLRVLTTAYPSPPLLVGPLQPKMLKIYTEASLTSWSASHKRQ
jgi:hypothetical protein